MPRSCSSSASSFFNSADCVGRSIAPSRSESSTFYAAYDCGGGGGGGSSTMEFGMEDVIAEPVDSSRSSDSISVTIRFRPLR